jgi:Domain of unknown function (DUF4170)
MNRQYWVIGAEYGDFGFTQPRDGTARLIGPFGCYQEASSAWRERAMASRHEAMTRYTIVSDVPSAATATAATQ